MKKLLLSLGTAAATVAPLATTIACGTTSAAEFSVRTVGNNTAMMDALQTSQATFGATWGDARVTASAASDNIVAIGVEKNRVPNDGIQARSDMGSHDIFVIQELFQRLIVDKDQGLVTGQDEDGDDILVFDVYNHGAYESITDIDRKVNYMDAGEIKEANMLASKPAEDNANGGTIFGPLGTTGTYADFVLKDDLDIQFIPSNDPTEVQEASQKLNTYLSDNLDVTNGAVNITVASDYNTAATQLKENNIDLAFLPVGSWAAHASGTNFILQSGRPTQVATLGFDGTNVTLPGATITNQGNAAKAVNAFSSLYVSEVKAANMKATDLTGNIGEFVKAHEDSSHDLHRFAIQTKFLADSTDDSLLTAGSYESIIYGDAKDELVQDILALYDAEDYDYTKDFSLDASLLEGKSYVATSNTSSSSYIYPELWFYRHFEQTFK